MGTGVRNSVRAIPERFVDAESSESTAPIVPTIVVGTWKGGAWKTSISTSLAERLAFTGANVLLLTTDDQEDAKARLGVEGEAGPTTVSRGTGTVVVVGARGSVAVDLLYRTGAHEYGKIDLVVVDTPPILQGGSLPGVLLVCPIDGKDAARNAVLFLRKMPATSLPILVRVGSNDSPKDWEYSAETIGKAIGRDVAFLAAPVPTSETIKEAQNDGVSVYDCARRGHTLAFVNAIEAIARAAWTHAYGENDVMPALPKKRGKVYIPGWDDEDAS